MSLKHFLESIEPQFEKGGKHEKWYPAGIRKPCSLRPDGLVRKPCCTVFQHDGRIALLSVAKRCRQVRMPA